MKKLEGNNEEGGLTLALRMRARYRGKVQMLSKVPVHGIGDFAVWHAPAVADPSQGLA